MKKISLYFLFLGAILSSCQSKKTEETIIEEEQETITPVTVTSLATEPMVEYIELNATSAFLQQGFVKASANGYIQSVNAQVGKMVSSQQRVFVLKTKEAQSIGNSINALDSTFKFFGIINIKAGTTGYISEINHEPGDYVQEGDQLAVINDLNSFVFILNLPYELRQYVINKVNSKIFKQAKYIKLDDEAIPLAEVKVSKNKDFFVKALLTESKVGLRLILYAGKIGNNKKTQIFVEPEIKRLAFDQNDLHPNDVFTKVEATFLDGTKASIDNTKAK